MQQTTDCNCGDGNTKRILKLPPYWFPWRGAEEMQKFTYCFLEVLSCTLYGWHLCGKVWRCRGVQWSQSLISSFLQFVSIQVEMASKVRTRVVNEKIHKETGKIAGERELENGAVVVFSNQTFRRRFDQVRRRWPWTSPSRERAHLEIKPRSESFVKVQELLKHVCRFFREAFVTSYFRIQ